MATIQLELEHFAEFQGIFDRHASDNGQQKKASTFPVFIPLVLEAVHRVEKQTKRFIALGRHYLRPSAPSLVSSV
jgi:hypothetical protein